MVIPKASASSEFLYLVGQGNFIDQGKVREF